MEKEIKKLEQMIEEGCPYEEILKQSQVVDEYINKSIREAL